MIYEKTGTTVIGYQPMTAEQMMPVDVLEGRQCADSAGPTDHIRIPNKRQTIRHSQQTGLPKSNGRIRPKTNRPGPIFPGIFERDIIIQKHCHH